jgi:hypothetical protein
MCGGLFPKKTKQIYQKFVVVAQKSKIGLGLKFDPLSPHSSRPGCARLVNSSLVKRPMLCSCNQWVLFVFETCKPVLAITAKQVDALLDTVVQYLGGISNSLSCRPKKLAC